MDALREKREHRQQHQQRNIPDVRPARERAEKDGEVFTFCDNYRTFVDYPAMGARSLGWLAWSLGARGWLTSETLGSYRTAWEAPVLTYAQFGGATVWGMGQMFYPEPLSGAPLPSLRWEVMREGCDDYEYLWLLREALKVTPNADAQHLVDTAARRWRRRDNGEDADKKGDQRARHTPAAGGNRDLDRMLESRRPLKPFPLAPPAGASHLRRPFRKYL